MGFSLLLLSIIMILLFVKEKLGIIGLIGITIIVPKAVTLFGIAVSKLGLLVMLVYLIIRYYKSKKRKTLINNFPLKKAVYIVLTAFLFVTIFKISFGIQNLLIEFLVKFSLGIAIWVVLVKENDSNEGFYFIEKLFLVICLYGLFCFLTNTNPYINFIEHSFGTESTSQIHDYNDSIRVNDKRQSRTQSFFNHPIRYGAHLAMLTPFILSFLITNRKKKKVIFYALLLFLLLINILLANSRSSLIQLFVSLTTLFILLKPKDKFITFQSAVAVFVCLLLLSPFLSSYYETIFSAFQILSGSTATTIGGSSIDMRLSQLAVAFSVFSDSPIFGHGLGYTAYLVTQRSIKGLLGAESFLFQILIDLGVVGIIAYTLFFVFAISTLKSIKRSINDYKSRYMINSAIALTYGYIVFVIATGELDTFYFYFILISLTIRHVYNKKLQLLDDVSNQ